MPQPTASDYQAQILREVGDPNSTLQPVLATVWNIYGDKSPLRLQFLYTKRAALDQRLAEEQPATDYKAADDLSVSRSQRFTHLQQMHGDCTAEIVRIEAQLRSIRAPAAGALSKTAPTTPPWPDSPDRNAPVYQGDTYCSDLPRY